MTTVLQANGWVEIPEVFRKVDALKAGQRFEIERVGHGEYRVLVEEEQKGLASMPQESLFDVLLSCPVKDWWVGPDRTERTTLEPPSLFAE